MRSIFLTVVCVQVTNWYSLESLSTIRTKTTRNKKHAKRKCEEPKKTPILRHHDSGANYKIEFNLKFLNNKKKEKNLPQSTGAGQHTATRQGAQNLQLFINNLSFLSTFRMTELME
jgi:hypothetical protein